MLSIADTVSSMNLALSGAPNFWIGNVTVMAGVSSIMHARGWRPSSRSAFPCSRKRCARMRREGDTGMQLAEIAQTNPAGAIGSYPMFACARHRSRFVAAGRPDYESGGQEFESLRARQ